VGVSVAADASADANDLLRGDDAARLVDGEDTAVHGEAAMNQPPPGIERLSDGTEWERSGIGRAPQSIRDAYRRRAMGIARRGTVTITHPEPSPTPSSAPAKPKQPPWKLPPSPGAPILEVERRPGTKRTAALIAEPRIKRVIQIPARIIQEIRAECVHNGNVECGLSLQGLPTRAWQPIRVIGARIWHTTRHSSSIHIPRDFDEDVWDPIVAAVHSHPRGTRTLSDSDVDCAVVMAELASDRNISAEFVSILAVPGRDGWKDAELIPYSFAHDGRKWQYQPATVEVI
jgi:proteasome lid subunit RPN8/RPN11